MKVLVTFPDSTESEIAFDELLKTTKYTVLYFYPKDKTPGCTLEAIAFAKHFDEFVSKDTQIIGVSKDGFRSHCSFIENHGLPFPLISDADYDLHRDSRFQCVGTKSMFGKSYIGTIRSTFLLNSSGEVLQSWKNISVTGHVQAVLDYITGLS